MTAVISRDSNRKNQNLYKHLLTYHLNTGSAAITYGLKGGRYVPIADSGGTAGLLAPYVAFGSIDAC